MSHSERAEIVARTAFAKNWEQLAHTARVVTQLRRMTEVTDEEVAVAWLHDVIEDTDVHYADLADMGFPRLVIDAVNLVTRVDTSPVSYHDYKERLLGERSRAGHIARRVKLADARENLERCHAAIGVPKWERLAETRYAPLVAALEATLRAP